MKKILLLVMLLGITFSNLSAGTYSGGTGTSGDPYQISTLADLTELSTTASDWASDKYFIQTSDIDATSTSTLNFDPIGNFDTPFQGSYDGQNHKIINLNVNKPLLSGVGLFGYVGGNGLRIKDVGLINVSIIGQDNVGGLVGTLYVNSIGSVNINNCFSTGTISGEDYIGGLVGVIVRGNISQCYSTCGVSGNYNVGGFVGSNFGSGAVIDHCYSTGNVNGDDRLGGFAGSNYHTINSCYSLGNVSRNGSQTDLAGFIGYSWGYVEVSNCYSTGLVNYGTDNGFVGYDDGGNYSNNFFDQTTSGQTTGIGATAKTTAQMKTQNTFTDAGWDFGTDNTDWVMSSNITFAGYPTLRWTGAFAIETEEIDGGLYGVESVMNLVWIAENSSRWSLDFYQVDDINMWTSPSWDGKKGWTPLGNSTTKFIGTYHGASFEISNLYINRSTTSYIGFIGYGYGCDVISTILRNVFIVGGFGTGALMGVGQYSVNISYSSTTGFVNGISGVGGLVGGMSLPSTQNSITNSYSTCNVAGDGSYVGGFIGYVYYTNISDCYSKGSVNNQGEDGSYTGGFAGMTSSGSSITECYSLSPVTSIYNYVGGFVGFSEYPPISKSYSTGSVKGVHYVGGFAGMSECDISNCYSTGNVTTTISFWAGGFVGYVNPNGFVIQNCYSTGSVSKLNANPILQTNRGFVGYSQYENFARCYWDIETSGSTNTGGFTGKIFGKSTSNMKAQSTFTNWDFSTIWNIESGDYRSYPYLRDFTYDTPEASPEVNPIPGLKINILYYVKHDAIGTNDGSSWINAFTSLQSALNVAVYGDQIWVARGTYRPTIEVGGAGNRYKSFQMKNDVRIYGGFAGTEASDFDVADRDIDGNETILSGDLNGDDDFDIDNGGYQNNTGLDNSYRVISNINGLELTSSAILDGFTIMGGNANGSSPFNEGSGIYNKNNSPTLKNLIIKNNYANNGAGLYFETSNSSLYNLLIYNNVAVRGGGIYWKNSTTSNLVNLTIVSNKADRGGGVYYNTSENSDTYSLKNSIIWGNSASLFGKQLFIDGGTANLLNSCYSNGSGDIFYTANFSTNDCITSDPLFADADNDDYKILGKSPCTDTGNDAYNSETTDIRGLGFGRKLDKTDNTETGTIDMGAYEYKEGTDPAGCEDKVWVDASYGSHEDFGETHFTDLGLALDAVCEGGTVNIANVSNTSYNDNVSFDGLTVILGDFDFELSGNIIHGYIQTTGDGRLVMNNLSQGITKTFPITDGTYNYTMTITTSDANSPDISVRIKNNNQTGNINSDFWDIYGPDNLDATATFRVDKAAIAPKKINSNTQLRYFDGTKYTPVNGDNFSIEEFDTYYIVSGRKAPKVSVIKYIKAIRLSEKQ